MRANANGINKTYAADLIDMQAFSKVNKGIKYLLAVLIYFLNLFESFKTENLTGRCKCIFKDLKRTKT